MDYKLLLIPVAVVLVGIIVMVMLNKKGKSSVGVAQNVMRDFVRTQIPAMQNVSMKIINLLEDAVNAQHIWIVAYNQDGMFLIPAESNPLTRTIERYEDLTPGFYLKKQLASNLFTGNKSEEIDYVPFSAIANTIVDSEKKKIKIIIENATKSFRYQNKDCFGADQQELIEEFLKYLKNVGC